MKTPVLRFSLLLSAVTGSLAFSAPPIAQPVSQSPGVVEAARRVANGMTCADVIAAAGQPDARLDANVWVYWHFTAAGVPESRQLDTLLVVFAGGRVRFLKFVAAGPVRAFLARQESEPLGRLTLHREQPPSW